jgi:hypothetical protein
MAKMFYRVKRILRGRWVAKSILYLPQYKRGVDGEWMTYKKKGGKDYTFGVFGQAYRFLENKCDDKYLFDLVYIDDFDYEEVD